MTKIPYKTLNEIEDSLGRSAMLAQRLIALRKLAVLTHNREALAIIDESLPILKRQMAHDIALRDRLRKEKAKNNS